MKFLRSLFDRAVEVADPMKVIPSILPPKSQGRVVVIGAGKASARMAEAVEQVWGPCEGLVITRYGYARPCQGIEIVEAAHPVSDEAGVAATKRILNLLTGLGENDFVLALISGGGSALFCAPAGRMELHDKQTVHQALLACGAPIDEMNVVRKHLSEIKGGQLAAAAFPARMLSLLISDVPGDDPADIASGPTVGEVSTVSDARAIVERYGLALPESALELLNGRSSVISPEDDRLGRCENQVISAPSHSLAAAASLARDAGYQVRILGDAIEGEAAEAGREQAQLALDLQRRMKPGESPLVLLSGGECTVTGTGGVGGPNAEFALSAAIELNGAPGISLIACDTDGVDGAAEVAGAFVGPETLELAGTQGLDAEYYLTGHDSHSFFEQIDGQVVTGPTLTNVNDFRAILIENLEKDND